MGTSSSVDAGIGQYQPLDGLSTDDVRTDDFLYVIFGDVSVPDGIGIDHHVGTVLTLIETSRLVGTDHVAHTMLGQNFLEMLLQCAFAVGVAASAGVVLVTLVGADKDVLLKFWHASRLQQQRDQSIASTCEELAGRCRRVKRATDSVRRR